MAKGPSGSSVGFGAGRGASAPGRMWNPATSDEDSEGDVNDDDDVDSDGDDDTVRQLRELVDGGLGTASPCCRSRACVYCVLCRCACCCCCCCCPHLRRGCRGCLHLK